MARRSGVPDRFHGFLIIDKPAGWTSHDVVARVRRLVGQRQVGHAGTLDPAATGVLPVAVGYATKTLEHLGGAGKSYIGDVVFGVETDSEDADGRVIRTASAAHVDRAAVEAMLAEFRGDTLQVPPMRSALKVGGKRLHELAREGIVLELEPRPVTIHHLELLAWDAPVASIAVACSKGTYIRSLARDLGERAGCGAHLGDLVRTEAGPFRLEDAWTLSELAEMDLAAEWESVALHPDCALADLGAIVVDAHGQTEWNFGRRIADAAADDATVRVYNEAGEWIGVGVGVIGQGWQPIRVIAEAA